MYVQDETQKFKRLELTQQEQIQLTSEEVRILESFASEINRLGKVFVNMLFLAHR